MIRPLPFFSVLLCLALGFSLFRLKYEVQSLEEGLVRIDRQKNADLQEVHLLAAEWTYLTRPERLAQLAGRHFALQPVTAAQEGRFDTLPLRSDEHPSAGDDKDVPIAQILQAMQVAQQPAARGGASVKGRSVE